jgi:hypothetical protein
MDSSERRRKSRERLVRELGRFLRQQARGRWSGVRTARRSAQGHQVWRFRPSPDAGERFLHVSNEALAQARNSSRPLVDQLAAGDWLDRLDTGGETAVRLTPAGRIESYRS